MPQDIGAATPPPLSVEARALLFAAIDQPAFVVDAAWRLLFMNEPALAFFGRAPDIIGTDLFTSFPRAKGSAVERFFAQALAAGSPQRVELLSPSTARWIDLHAIPAPPGAGGGLLVMFRDMHEERDAREREALLRQELDHRIRNLFATVLSVVQQIQRTTEMGGSFSERLQARLFALAAAHDQLSRAGWLGARLDQLLLRELQPYAPPETGRARLEGPPIFLPPNAAVSMALVFHELATNAAKHGALRPAEGGGPVGHVAITWEVVAVRSADAPREIRLSWSETGGPALTDPPLRRGFGSRLIERGALASLGGDARLFFEPHGLRCVLHFTLPGESATPDDAAPRDAAPRDAAPRDAAQALTA